jgi:transcriptional regulator with XRE-family HTH domain
MPKKKAPTGFAFKLRSVRRQKGLTQKELARLTGLHKLAIAKLEQGFQEPTWSTVVALVDALELDGGTFWVPMNQRRQPAQARIGRPPAHDDNRQRKRS